MPQQKNPFAELVALTELYLLQNYSLQEKVAASRETYEFFVDYAQKARWRPAQTRQIPPQPMMTKTPPAPPSSKKEQMPVPATPPPADPEPAETLSLHPPSSPPQIDPFTDFRRIFSEKFPSESVLDTPPRETTVEVGILSFQPTQQERLFLNHLAAAVTVSYCPASIISLEALHMFGDLRLVIAAENIHEDRIAGHAVPVVRMLHPSAYLTNPLLKAELWESIHKQVQELDLDGAKSNS